MNRTNVISYPLIDTALVPDQLADSAAAAVRDIVAEAACVNTTRSYAAALRYWAAWFTGRYGQPFTLPVPEATVVQFLVDHVSRRSKQGVVHDLPPLLDAILVGKGFKATRGPLKLTTIVHRIAVLSRVHALKRQPNPCEQPGIRHLLSRARRAAVKRGEKARKKTAATRTELEAMLATCDDSLSGLRDRALLLFGFASGGRRRSEIAAAEMASLHRVGESAYVYRLEHSKTQQAGPTADSTPEKPILDVAADAMEAWLTASGIAEGAIFRRLWKSTIGGPLSPAAVGSIVKRRAQLAGVKGDFAGHSLRSGFVTEAGRQGIALSAVMAMTEHRSVPTVMGYFQAGSAINNPAASLFAKRKLE
ncbi:site-specific integrase [Pseudolysobacter antarcticus]|uniref:Site-specific integrase n=1 Tax=Pseudolysobacter antarcticus TaxID=2511995 RepID=A0A411HK14_9GAMM|nr:site-specific integrase [Pseudolysobacter antarcticus]QBB70744.1 site-specific integrase [Pseudolysobacter antarcticus]